MTSEQFQSHVSHCRACTAARGLGFWQSEGIKPSALLCDLGKAFLEQLTARFRRAGFRRPDGPGVRDCTL